MKPMRFEKYEHCITININDTDFDGIVEYEMEPDGHPILLRVFALKEVAKKGQIYCDHNGDAHRGPKTESQDINWAFVSEHQKIEWRRAIMLHWERLGWRDAA